MDIDDCLHTYVHVQTSSYTDPVKDIKSSVINEESYVPVTSLEDIQDSIILKRIDTLIPILKISLCCLEKKKDEEKMKEDYDRLLHAFNVFTYNNSKEKLKLYAVCESALEKLAYEYKKYMRKYKKNQSEAETNNVMPSLGIPVAPPSSIAIVPVVHNVVSTVDLGCRLELTKIALAARNVEYNPKRFHAVIMRLHEPRTATLIFRTGKIVTVGAKSETDAHLAARKCARILQKLGNNVKFRDFKIQNLVATCDVRFPVNIENLYKAHAQFCCYEPELFAGLIYRLIKPKLTLLIFVTGKFVMTGGKSREMLYEACDFIYPVLRSFRKQ